MANLHALQLFNTLDSSPENIGISEGPSSSQQELPSTTSRVKRMSAVVGQTVDKLSRSISGKAGRTSPGPATTPPPSASHRRLFSLSRKGKGRETSGDSDSEPSSSRYILIFVSTRTQIHPSCCHQA